jgi:FlaA1/EpsC-like NDP-sugar epimerase
MLLHLRNRYLMAADVLGLLFIPATALLLRTEAFAGIAQWWGSLVVYTLFFLILKIALFYRRGLYGAFWAYASVPELVVALKAVGLAALLEILIYFAVLAPLGLVDKSFPRSIPFVSALLTAGHIIGLRSTIRILYRKLSRRQHAAELAPVLIAGAGEAGLMVARELQSNPQLGLDPIGFVDDDIKKSGRRISDIPVFGSLEAIKYVVDRFSVEQVIIAMPTVSGEVVRRVNQLCKEAGVTSKIIPGLFDIIGGTARVTQTRSVQLEDLLRRGVVKTDSSGVQRFIGGARVLVTGAGGSIGSEIARQVRSFHPSDLIILGHGETSVFQLMKELEEHPLPGVIVHPVVADVRDPERMDQVFRKFKPDVVFHAAAHKHVWLMEQNLPDAISNNVLGTRTLVQMAGRHDVRRFVMISSDKAVNPTSVMGVTKRVAELIVQEAALRSRKGFITVRFGNVLGSRGSVVPLFKHQIEMGGPVCVTHPDVTRYFMTIPEAVQLVLQAGSMGDGGEVFVLDMGEQLKVMDVARDLIRLSGFTEEQIGIAITGLKPGEKMYEELFYDDSDIQTTAHEKIRVSRRNDAQEYNKRAARPTKEGDEIYESPLWMDVDTLIEVAKEGDNDLIEQMLKRLVPQYTPARNYDPNQAAPAILRGRPLVQENQPDQPAIVQIPKNGGNDK